MTSSGAAFAEREYNLRAAFPDHLQWFARWAADSERARAAMRVVRDVRYGEGPKQTVDLFPAERPRGALLFIHGGYWRALDKDDHSFIAPPFVAQGLGVAVVNYDLCPARGTSADAIVGGVSISGVFDLEPLVDVSFNSDLGLELRSARELSPIHLDPRLDAPLLLAAGADETSEFIRQSRCLWQSWPSCRPAERNGPLFIPGKHHFSVLTEFADPQSELFAAAMRTFDSE